MKTLKFMLAAATAIGLASASYAKQGALDGSIDFEGPNPLASGFVFDGAEGDNDSEVVTPGANSTGHALKVSVGTDPLLRALSTLGNPNGDVIPLAGEGSYEEVTIDTMVQFTVTPYSDPVTANASDKLMIYLKEMTNEVGEVTGTNLMVKAAMFKAAYTDEDEEDHPAVKDVADYAVAYADDSAVTVNSGVWYSLTTKAVMFNGELMFEIYLGGQKLKPITLLNRDAGEDANALCYFPAITAGTGATTLTYVGFAGEGMVDELVFTTEDGVTAVDFTFTLNPNVTSVAYTLSDSATTNTITETTTVSVYPNDTVKITEVVYASGYAAAAGSPAATGVTGDFANGYVVGNSGNCSLEFSADVSSVSFTFVLGTGVNGVAWTIDGTTTNTTLTGSASAGATVTIADVTYADWYVADTTSLYKGQTATVAAGASYAVNAKMIGEGGDKIEVPAGTTAADLGISNAAFANDTPEQLTKLAVWAQAKNVSKSTINDTSVMSFDPETETAKAFLLNCAVSEVETEAAKFKFDSITPGETPEIDQDLVDSYNGTVTVKGAATVDGTYSAPVPEGAKFFKATLTK